MSLVWQGSTGLTVAPESGAVEMSDRITLTDIYGGPYLACIAGMLPRGYYGTGGNFPAGRTGWVVSRCGVQPEKGGKGILKIAWEAGTNWNLTGAHAPQWTIGGVSVYIPAPSPEFSLAPMELYPRVERNAKFAGIETETIRTAYMAAQAATEDLAQISVSKLTAWAASGDPDTAAQGSLGLLLLDKLQGGEETYYEAGFRLTYSLYSYTMPTLSRGGIIQAPSTVLGTFLTSGFPSGLSWLRLADAMDLVGVNGSLWKQGGTWLGGSSGYWDSELYPSS